MSQRFAGQAFGGRPKLDASQAHAVWESYRKIELEQVDVDIGAAIEIAIALGLYAFDGYVLEPAKRHRVPLITLDAQLAAAAAAHGVTLLDLSP